MLHPVDRPATLSDLAYSRIRRGILAEGLLAEKRTSVVALAESLGMSRSPVRSAIERLASEGLVKLEPGGVSLIKHSHAKLRKLLEVRAVLEGLSSRLAAPNIDSEALSELEEIQQKFAESISTGDVAAARELDLVFHQTIMRFAENEFLQEELTHVQARVIVGIYTIAWTPNHQQALDEHRQILEALRAQDAVQAERYAVTHMRQLMHRIENAGS